MKIWNLNAASRKETFASPALKYVYSLYKKEISFRTTLPASGKNNRKTIVESDVTTNFSVVWAD